MNRKAIYPGSFDPITYGHLNIVKRGIDIFDSLIVAVVENPDKTPLFSAEKRVEILEEALADYPEVEVDSFSGLTVDYVKACGAKVILRGLRSISDFENEKQMATMNKEMAGEVETVFLMTEPEYAHVSSSLIKDIAGFEGEISHFVPESSARALQEKFS